MRFRVGGDNRNGSVSVKSGRKGDSRDDSYNVDPSKRYQKIARKLSESAGSGDAAVAASLDTYSEFIGYANGACDFLALKSVALIAPPRDAAAVGRAVVQESIWMNIRIEQTGKVRLTAAVVSDLDIAEVMLTGPSFEKPIRVYDDADETLDISKPGEYSLRCGYQMTVEFPNPGQGGRPLKIEIEATLSPV